MRLQLAATAVALALVAAAAPAAAQSSVEARGMYYKETSNRVVLPRIDLDAALPGDASVNASYSLDTITSASIAQGNVLDQSQTEYRSEVGVGGSKRLDDTTLAAGYRNSHESDYLSWGLHAGVAQDLAEKNATLSLGYAYLHDSVRSRFAREQVGVLTGHTVTAYLSQLLSPVSIVEVGYELQYLDGYQANVYRFVNAVQEKHPKTRDRHTFAGRVAYFVPATGTTGQLWYRYYVDGWNVRAHAIEPRVYQDLGHGLELRLSYRYYTQTRAYFWKDLPAGERLTPCPTDPMAPGYDSCGITGDDKLRPFSSHFIEGQLRVALAGLEGVPVLGWFHEGAIELSYASLFQDNTWGRCGPGSTAVCEDRLLQFGISLPF